MGSVVSYRKAIQKLGLGKLSSSLYTRQEPLPFKSLPSKSLPSKSLPSKSLPSLPATPPGPKRAKRAKPSTRRKDVNPKENLRATPRSMVQQLQEQHLPGRYLSLDCEMVGVGINGSRSSLARVSVVNYYGWVILDEYVKQREPVVDYRTRWSGIRPSDMINAKHFEEVQKTVNDLLDGRILIGHAIHHDLEVLLLSHPLSRTRDTQLYAYKFALSKKPRISLKDLAKQELGIYIQTGEHSSVEDAKTTMNIYRLHEKDWERASGTISGYDSEVLNRRGLRGLDGKSLT